MSLDIDRPPIDFEEFSYEFKLWITSFYQTLTQFMSSNGFFVPNLTTAERDKIIVSNQPGEIPSPVPGQMIWNTSLTVPQIWTGTAWKTFTIT